MFVTRFSRPEHVDTLSLTGSRHHRDWKLFDSYGYTAPAKALRTLAKPRRQTKNNSQNEGLRRHPTPPSPKVLRAFQTKPVPREPNTP